MVGSLFAIGVLMMVFVIPKLTDMLSQTGAQLPLATRILKGTSDFMVNFWWLVFLIIIVIIILVYFYSKSVVGRKHIDNIKLRLPIFGKLFNYISVIRFSLGLRTLMLGGVDVVSGLEISSAMVGNVVYSDLIDKTRENIESGGGFGAIFENNKLVPKMLPQMLDTGEATGKIEDVLEKVSDFYTREVNNLISNMMSLMEPFIMVVLGVAVGLMITAIVLPMYEISTNM